MPGILNDGKFISKSTRLRSILIIVIGIILMVFLKNCYFLYNTPIGTVTDVTEKPAYTKTGDDGKRRYTEQYYTQKIKVKINNSSFKGKTAILSNTYEKSCVYGKKYRKGQDIFIERIEHGKDNKLVGTPRDVRRDYVAGFSLIVMVSLFLIFGGKEGGLTLASLFINLAVFQIAITLYFKGINILALTFVICLFFTWLLLRMMYGNDKKTRLAFLSTLVTTAITVTLGALTMKLQRVDYDFLDYLIQPYDQHDANLIFLSEIMICSLGAVIDVVVTMVVTILEIEEHRHGKITSKEIMQSCRTVGDEVVGTMISIMFFTNLACGIPFALLSMRNGIALSTVLKYNSFFEIARFLTGSIGTVLSIPVSGGICALYCNMKNKKREVI